MARIIIFGGHGRVALLAARLLTERGDQVTSVIRNPDHREEVAATGAEPVVADVETSDVAALAELIAGHDAVVWSAGAGGGNPERTYRVDRDAAIDSMKAAEQAGVRRYVMVSWFGSRADHGVPSTVDFFHYAEAKWAADEFLRTSDLEWTILGPSGLTMDAATGLIDTHAKDAGTVPRGDVAAVIVAVLADPRTIGATIRFNGGQTPIIDAILPD